MAARHYRASMKDGSARGQRVRFGKLHIKNGVNYTSIGDLLGEDDPECIVHAKYTFTKLHGFEYEGNLKEYFRVIDGQYTVVREDGSLIKDEGRTGV